MHPILLMASPPPSRRAHTEESTRDWASLGIFDCLEDIAKRLQSHSFDYVAFRSVCQTWRSAAPKIKFAPLLIFPICPVTGTLPFFAPSDDRPFSIVVPEVRNKVVCGLTRGMLALMDEDLRMSLLNPFTKVSFELPPATLELATLSGRSVAREAGRWIDKGILGSPVIFEKAINLAKLPRIFIKEVALSCPPTSNAEECIVMAILAASNKVAYCKLGENVWKLVDTNLSTKVRTIAFYRNKAYIVDISGDIAISDLGSLPLSIVPQRAPMVPFNRSIFRILESSNGDLLKVTLVVSNKWDDEKFKYHYEVHKLVEEGECLALSRLEDIGKEVLFLSRFYSCHFSGSDIQGYKGNHLYFSEATLGALEPPVTEVPHMEIVNVTDGQKELVPCHWRKPRYDPACWFKPDLLI